MRRATATVILAAAVSVPLCFAVAAPAVAAPEDVTFTAVSDGNSITGTFSFTGGSAPSTCLFLDFDTFDAITQTYAVYGLVYPNVDSTSVSFTDVDVAEGDYILDWNCAGSGEQWGTGVYNGSAAQVPVTVVTPVDEPDPSCTGSVCLPTGSFGF
ncbi:hypothetical protein [Rhodococcoides yunnanense]|uniref:AA1-like domain-containing protein n=1 Tax=Rhodococcoides yunnanense TaxID=278209 RepID=A0ABU4B7B0_9NOCA|nr:hypothetical protein [Rhodococcus yunnanensis]MDV6260072.1 hypothetical protein [Rhodococcus yunnanensis]